jgi:formyltetrahydrofolate-dependent phosphoribosylglycinamide formyltransferase
MSQKAATPRWAVFISGYGSNLQAIFDAQSRGLIEKGTVQLVVSSSAEAYGVERAQKQGVPAIVTPYLDYAKSSSKKIDWDRLHQQLINYKIEWIFLAGFMKIIPSSFIQHWKGRMLNLHPSLLPKFPGLNAIEKSYQSGEAMGATVHFVTAELDGGPILIQKVAIPKKDLTSWTLEEAKEKLHKLEHQITVEAIRCIAEGDQLDKAEGDPSDNAEGGES